MEIKLTEATRIKVHNSDDLFGIMQRILKRENKTDKNREHFWVVGLETNCRIMFIELITLGTVNTAMVNPMEVFSFALQRRAVSIILVHSHPSGSLQPSDGDNAITDRMIQIGIFLNTPVFDHQIITLNSYYSYADNGLLDQLRINTKHTLNEIFKEKSNKELEKQALELGELRGEKKRSIEIARLMKSRKEPLEKIVDYTGLAKKEIEKLK